MIFRNKIIEYSRPYSCEGSIFWYLYKMPVEKRLVARHRQDNMEYLKICLLSIRLEKMSLKWQYEALVSGYSRYYWLVFWC